MDASVIHRLLTAEPFRPFRVHTTRTGAYDVAAPGDVLLTRSTLYLARDRDADGIAGSALALPLAQVASVEVV